MQKSCRNADSTIQKSWGGDSNTCTLHKASGDAGDAGTETAFLNNKEFRRFSILENNGLRAAEWKDSGRPRFQRIWHIKTNIQITKI